MRPPGFATRKEQNNASDEQAEGTSARRILLGRCPARKPGECNFGTNSD
jgi:hypothetical protein